MPLNKIIRSSMRVLYKLPKKSIYDTISINELMLQQHLHWYTKLKNINIYSYNILSYYYFI